MYRMPDVSVSSIKRKMFFWQVGYEFFFCKTEFVVGVVDIL